MRIFVPLLFVFLQNLFLFLFLFRCWCWCWCCCHHHSSQQAVSVSRCSYSKTRGAFYPSLSLFFCATSSSTSSFRFFAAFSSSFSLVFTRRRTEEEQKKKPKRATRETSASFSQSTRSTNKLKNDLRTTEQPTGRICPVLCLYHPHVVVVVVVKERAKPNERDDPFFSPRRSNGDFSR